MNLGSLSRHVIPPHLKTAMFEVLRSLPSPPADCLRDIHINQAFSLANFEEMFEELKGRAVLARSLKGTVFHTDVEKEREARRLLKASWRAMHRKW